MWGNLTVWEVALLLVALVALVGVLLPIVLGWRADTEPERAARRYLEDAQRRRWARPSEDTGPLTEVGGSHVAPEACGASTGAEGAGCVWCRGKRGGQ